jgi:hypothetical protein
MRAKWRDMDKTWVVEVAAVARAKEVEGIQVLHAKATTEAIAMQDAA